MFNYVRLSDGGPPRHDGPRTEVETIAAIGRRVLDPHNTRRPLDFDAMEQHRTIRQAIAAVIPGYEAIANIDDSRSEFHIDGRTFHKPTFATPTGNARLHAVPLPDLAPDHPDTLRLMTIRSEGQFNTVVYEEEDLYRGQERRDVILMAREDVERLDLTPDQKVTVRSSVGEMKDILVRIVDIRAGNAAMYYPEANVIVPRAADPSSRTPAFKNIAVTVHKQTSLPLTT